ncbi:hypothetical protein [Aureivirga marina]|uniref:hypothetical protein n=1 Tax=Aureivirga marina TaxID=1182451 RepID=UPI0018CAE558|nr:hypothetical protein [Aureivirga marina]
MKLHRKAYLSAFISFLIGTLFMCIFFYNSTIRIAIACYYYTLIAGIVNFSIFVLLMLKSLTNQKMKHKYYKGSAILFINIPVVLLYVFFSTKLKDTIRIEVVNATDSTISNLQISGCEDDAFISKLNESESNTKWILVKNICNISIDYELEGKTYSEKILEKVGPNMGHQLSYRVGLHQKD